jgi:hypothetical protein
MGVKGFEGLGYRAFEGNPNLLGKLGHHCKGEIGVFEGSEG